LEPGDYYISPDGAKLIVDYGGYDDNGVHYDNPASLMMAKDLVKAHAEIDDQSRQIALLKSHNEKLGSDNSALAVENEGLRDAVEKLTRERDELKPKRIPIEDFEASDGDAYLLFNCELEWDVGYYNIGDVDVPTYFDAYGYEIVATHVMPLPKGPTE